MGLKITYESIKKGSWFREDKTFQKESEVMAIIYYSDRYIFKLENGDNVSVNFVVEESGNIRRNPERLEFSKKELEMERLRAEKFINTSIASIANGNSALVSDGGSIDLSKYETLMDPQSTLSLGEEIIYTDLRTGHEKKGKINITKKDIYLEDGSPVKIQFVSE